MTDPNPKAPLDEKTEAAMLDLWNAVVGYCHTLGYKATARIQTEKVLDALRARISELLEETANRAADLWSDEVAHLKSITLTPEERSDIATAASILERSEEMDVEAIGAGLRNLLRKRAGDDDRFSHPIRGATPKARKGK